MVKETNTFSYAIKNGNLRGYFNVYQAKSGGIAMTMGHCSTYLTEKQIKGLGINIYDLEDFEYDSYLQFYKQEIKDADSDKDIY